MSKGHIPGGGAASKNVVRPGYNTGKPKERVIPAGVYQYGQALGNHVTGVEGGGGDLGYHGINPMSGKAGFPSELGNARAVSCGQGPGGGRTIHRAGSQGQQGAPVSGNPAPVSGKQDLTGLGWKR
jgi:hypothetical protein